MGRNLTAEEMKAPENDYTYGFFSLKNNHDVAIVRFMHENYDDFSRRAVHFTKMEGQKYKQNVNCLKQSFNDPDSVCPFCQYASREDKDPISTVRKRVFIELLVYKITNTDPVTRQTKVVADYTDNPKRLVWERPRQFDDELFSLCSRHNPLHATVFGIERMGEAGSTKTSYSIYAISGDMNSHPYTLPEELYNPDGVQCYDKNYDEMMYYIENGMDGKFPPSEGQGELPQRRADVVQPQQVAPAPQQNRQVPPPASQPQVAPQQVTPAPTSAPTQAVPTRRRTI